LVNYFLTIIEFDDDERDRQSDMGDSYNGDDRTGDGEYTDDEYDGQYFLLQAFYCIIMMIPCYQSLSKLNTHDIPSFIGEQKKHIFIQSSSDPLFNIKVSHR
jgi:hypothetical protein